MYVWTDTYVCVYVCVCVYIHTDTLDHSDFDYTDDVTAPHPIVDPFKNKTGYPGFLLHV